MKLYDAKSFPSPRRVRIFLAEKGIGEIESVEVDVSGGEARSEVFLSMNPLGEVPVLELDDGTHISEITAISAYFEEMKPEPALCGKTPQEKAAIEMWQKRMEHGLANAVAAYFHHATPGLGELETYQNKDWGEKNRERAIRTLQMLDGRLDGQDFVAGDSFSIADITALCGMDFAKFCGIEMPNGKGNLQAWYERVSSRPSASA